MRYEYVTGISNFDDILRFDATDVLTNTNEVEYSLVNRIYAKHLDPNVKDCDLQGMSTLTIGGVPQVGAVPWEAPPSPDAQPCASGPREILSWEVGQKYFFDPTFGNALLPGQRNVFATTADFTGIAFLNEARRFAPVISRLRIETSPRTNTEWDVDYDLKAGRINDSTALVNLPRRPLYRRRRRRLPARDRQFSGNDATGRGRFPPASCVVGLRPTQQAWIQRGQ